ncbi:MAG TPA: hypothetical protein VFU06_05220 [Longimicrobiales bacterium]|nr:hypothetical protein [Longimicrobiales bacterium]
MKRKAMFFFVPALAFGLAACTAEQTEEGDLPDVDVQGGQLPEYDVDAADVEIGTDTQTVRVPDIDVTAPEPDPEPEPPTSN